MSLNSKVEKLLGNQNSKVDKLLASKKPTLDQPQEIKDNSNEKQKKIVENLLGRSTLIIKPNSLTETQYLDLQKSKKYTAEVLSPDKHKKNLKRNTDCQKTGSIQKFSTYKSLNYSCQKVFVVRFI